MTSDTLEQTHLWFKKAFPTPKSKNLHTQLGVHFEEVVEMLEELGSTDPTTIQLLSEAKTQLSKLAEWLKKSDKVIYINHGGQTRFLDSLCDQMVTGVGVAYMFKMDISGAMKEVNKSNFSKFDHGVPLYDHNFKLIKGPMYFKPNLTPFVHH